MDLQTILAKVAKGEQLTKEELDFVAAYKPDDSRVPLKRLNEEIDKRKQAEAATESVKNELAELKEKLEKLETDGLDEAQKQKLEADKKIAKLQKQVDDLTAKSAAAEQKASALERSSKIKELAAKNKFRDAKYLDFMLKDANIDLADDDAVSGFMKDLEKSSPGMFDSAAKGGTGTGGTGEGGNHGNRETILARLDELRKKPEFTAAESAEYVNLSNELKQADEQSANNK
jgi:hypothetical protein